MKAGEVTLVLRNQLWTEAAVAVARTILDQGAGVRQHHLAAVAVAGVAGLVGRQMVSISGFGARSTGAFYVPSNGPIEFNAAIVSVPASSAPSNSSGITGVLRQGIGGSF
jgi:hypothetical protein